MFFVVMAHTSEAGWCVDWPVLVSTDKEFAFVYAGWAQNKANLLRDIHGGWIGVPEGKNEFDRKMEVGSKGVRYHVVDIPSYEEWENTIVGRKEK